MEKREAALSRIKERIKAKRRVLKSGLLDKIEKLPRKIVASCDGCGYKKTWMVETTDRYGLPIRVAVCPACALISQVDRLTIDGASRFYKDLYRPLLAAFYGYSINKDEVFKESKARSAEIYSVLRFFAGEIQQKRWIDIGGGTGGSIIGLFEKGVKAEKVSIVDPSAAETRKAGESKFSVLPYMAENPDGWTTQEYDLLLCLQSLDHVIDLRSVLRNFYNALKMNGLAAITVADYLFFKSIVNGRPCMDLKIDHTYYFTKDSLAKIAPLWGFNIERMGVTWPGNLVSVLRKTGEKISSPDNKEEPLMLERAEEAFELALNPVCPY